jgi:hypothetical protein
VPFFSH